MRFAGTALLCVVAAFGAAFLIRRAVDRNPTARATVAADTRTAPLRSSTTTSGRRTHAQDTASAHHRSRTPQLAAEFAPGVQRVTRQKPKPKHRKHVGAARNSGASTPTEPTDTSSEPTYTTPAPTEPAPTTGGSSSGSGSSGATHKSSGSGTGTTSIGRTGKGSGTTTIG